MRYDAIVIGAGFAGLYAVHRLRDTLGLSVLGLEAGGDVGGTWYWNRYPGARCDIESMHYSYSFSDELHREWKWSERFAAQPEILGYLNHVADRFGLRPAYRFGVRVTSMVWDEPARHWRVGTDDGLVRTARYVVSGAGNLSAAKQPEFAGLDRFTGAIYETSAWPHEPVDFTGRRVGVIGTGSSGIQAIPEIARQAAHLTVFQRTANFAVPLGNRPTDDDEWREVVRDYPNLRAAARNSFMGVPYEHALPSALAVDPEERERVYAKYWSRGGFQFLLSTFLDLLTNKESNDSAAQYIRDQIRRRVHDPATAKLLSPNDHAYGTKRPPFETDYYETFNRANVTLVDVRKAPIDAVIATGIRTAEAEYELDDIVLATGFDAFTRPLLNMNIVGRDGLRLEDKWADGPHTYLGLAIHGFPNLFTIAGPQSAVALYNNPLAIEDHVDFAAGAIQDLSGHGLDVIEASLEAETRWGERIRELASATLMPTTDSWYMGANIPGKPRACMIYLGGGKAYRAACADVVANGYRGFVRSAGRPDGGSERSRA